MTNPYNANEIRNAEIELEDVRERRDNLQGFHSSDEALSGGIQNRLQKLEEKEIELILDLIELGVKE